MSRGSTNVGMSDVLTSGEPLWKWNLRACARSVGLPDVVVLGVEESVEHLRVHVEVPVVVMGCTECGTRARVKERPVIELVDLPCFGRPTRLVWRKHRFTCPDPDCQTRSWTGEHRDIAPPRAAMTDRAGRWATAQVGHGTVAASPKSLANSVVTGTRSTTRSSPTEHHSSTIRTGSVRSPRWAGRDPVLSAVAPSRVVHLDR